MAGHCELRQTSLMQRLFKSIIPSANSICMEIRESKKCMCISEESHSIDIICRLGTLGQCLELLVSLFQSLGISLFFMGNMVEFSHISKKTFNF